MLCYDQLYWKRKVLEQISSSFRFSLLIINRSIETVQQKHLNFTLFFLLLCNSYLFSFLIFSVCRCLLIFFNIAVVVTFMYNNSVQLEFKYSSIVLMPPSPGEIPSGLALEYLN